MEAYTILDGWLGFLAFVGMVHIAWIVWPKVVVDIARQRLFEVRDNLFDMAASKKIDFNSAEYGEARIFINSMIRNAEHATVWRYVRYSIAMEENKHEGRGGEIIKILTAATTPNEVREAFGKSMRITTFLLFYRSPVLMALALIGKIITMILDVVFANGFGSRAVSVVKRRQRAAVQADLNADLRLAH